MFIEFKTNKQNTFVITNGLPRIPPYEKALAHDM